MKKYKTVALLPLKLNSERVKGKNFKLLAGKPLFAWILDSLLDVKEIDLIVINTDARQELYNHGLRQSDRVLIRDRKKNLCGDLVSMNLIIGDDVKNISADYYVMTHTTNPLIKSSTISEGLERLKSNPSKDSVFSVNEVKTRFYREDCSAVNHDPENLVRTQDLEPWYEENSCLYYFTRQSFEKSKARIGAYPEMMITPAIESLDIDEQHDWEMVSAIAMQQQKLQNTLIDKQNSLIKESTRKSRDLTLSLSRRAM